MNCIAFIVKSLLYKSFLIDANSTSGKPRIIHKILFLQSKIYLNSIRHNNNGSFKFLMKLYSSLYCLQKCWANFYCILFNNISKSIFVFSKKIPYNPTNQKYGITQSVPHFTICIKVDTTSLLKYGTLNILFFLFQNESNFPLFQKEHRIYYLFRFHHVSF